MGNEFYEYLLKFADVSLQKQKPREGDYEVDGIPYCGVCKKPRQGYVNFPFPTESCPNMAVRKKVAFACDCDKREEQRAKAEEQAKKDFDEIQRLRSVSLMDERMKQASFATFEATKSNEKCLRICKRYVEKFDDMVANNQGMIFWGDVGTGKSYAAACIANELLSRKIPVVMTSFVKVIAAIDADWTAGELIINQMNAAKLVILDDLGAERCTDTTLERIYNLVDSRYRRKLPMIVTTNIGIDQMKEELDIRRSRIYDRLFETCYPLQFTGPSWRKKAAAKSWDAMAKLLGDEDIK